MQWHSPGNAIAGSMVPMGWGGEPAQAGARQVAELARHGGGHIVLHNSISDVMQTLGVPPRCAP